MKNLVYLLLLITISAFGQENEFSKDPKKVKFHTEDIDNFWETFDESYPELKAKDFQKNYINKGSLGLKGFLKHRIKNGKNLSKIVRNNLAHYQSIREGSLSIAERKDEFYEAFRKFKTLYPKAMFPDVYFVIGAKNSGGTVFANGIIIGAEMFGKSKGTTSAIDLDYLTKVVTHESVHFQQNYPLDKSLLAQSIKEGSADFVTELISGKQVVNKYGEEHEKELWQEFQQKMNGNNYIDWLYYNKDKSRPNDLGYWIGYKISKAYFDKRDDKKQAIDEILNIQDFKKFLKESGYSGA